MGQANDSAVQIKNPTQPRAHSTQESIFMHLNTIKCTKSLLLLGEAADTGLQALHG